MSTIIDIVLILIIVKSACSGFKRGLFRELIDIIAMVVAVIVSFKYMGTIADLLYQTLPLLDLKILGISVVAINVLLFQIVAFIIMAILIYAAINITITITGLLQKLASLKLPANLNIIHKITGAIAGLITGYIIVFALLIAASPFTNNLKSYRQSKVKDVVMYNTPILTKKADKYTGAVKEVSKLTEKISADKDKRKHSNDYNLEALDIMLKYKVVSPERIEELKESNKLSSIENVDSVLNKYRKEEKND